MRLLLTERQVREIAAFCQVAKENGAMISLRELIGLAAINATEGELARAFVTDSALRAKFLLESGYVIERTPTIGVAVQEKVEEEDRRRARAYANLERAKLFGRTLVPGTVIVSVSGANSYLSAGEGEDIDFFCVTKTNGMWRFILKSLLLARIYQLANMDWPELCFSCVMDERWARETFSAAQPAIFARDALTAKLISGAAEYHSLLERAPWMADYFPVFYDVRLRETGRRIGGLRGGSQAGRSSAMLNSLLFYLLGSFLRLKSWALNRRLAKAAQRSMIFKTKVGTGHYIYESNRYKNLSAIYQELIGEQTSPVVELPPR